MKPVIQWLFGLGLIVLCLSSWAWVYYHHGKWGLLCLVGVIAVIIAYMAFLFNKKRKI